MNTIKKLSSMPYAQAHVEISPNGTIALFSYTTMVCQVDTDGFVLVTGLYSMTTRKHISAFAKEYLSPLNYYDLKRAYQERYVINYQTGEIIFWDEYEKGGNYND